MKKVRFTEGQMVAILREADRSPVPTRASDRAYLSIEFGNCPVNRLVVHIHTDKRLARLARGLPPHLG